MEIKFCKTERGFTIGEFKDRYGQECSIQDSSLASEAAIWLGVDVDIEGSKVGKRMHLTVEQVEVLIPVLQHFVKEQYLPEVGSIKRKQEDG